MSIRVDLPTPERVLAIGAHPDDIEFGCGATLAKWADAGADVRLFVCTDGSKGTWDGAADLAALVGAREEEQRLAGKVLGVSGITFLRRVDGELVADDDARSAVSLAIRTHRPDVVLSHDPWLPYRLHPDHQAAGHLAVHGIVAARDPHFFPEHGLGPHRPASLLLFEPARVDHLERVFDHLERKTDALLAHRSQWRSTMAIDDTDAVHRDAQRTRFVEKVHDEARVAGLRCGVRAAEAFARIDAL
jgi:LmbE family N-acetylglucosaminyl deacetylase